MTERKTTADSQGNDRKKGNSRFPAGMTERKTTADSQGNDRKKDNSGFPRE
jgi:hypothetical protein